MKIENLDHLGLVAGLVDEIGLVELTDDLLGRHSLNHISPGQVLKAMILNGLGFVSAPLYLFSEFFEGKPVEHLLGPGITAAHLNDDRLGRVLDRLFESGTTLFFLKVAMQAVQRFGVSVSQCHLDSTSFGLDGDYPSVQGAEDEPEEEPSTPQAIEICRGYSRDHRPDLKQFLVNLICSADGGIPVWFKVGSGNGSDNQTFAGLMSAFSEQWQPPALMVVDAAFYSEANLKQVGSLSWLSRVPKTLKAAQSLLDSSLDCLTEMPCALDGYRLWQQRQTYGGVEQRWILVESPHQQSDDWLKPLQKQEKGLNRQLQKLCRQVFACKPDATEALMAFQDSFEGYTLSASLVPVTAKRAPGRPKRAEATKPPTIGYQWQATLERTAEYEAQCRQRHQRFILATNVLDEEAYPAERLLREYKGQQKVERGFRFLKDPLFFTSSVFVKKPQRVEALALVMALTLLVYSLGQRQLRAQLAQASETVLDQKRRPTSTPTFRWVLQKFQAIHWVSMNGVKQVSNLAAERCKIIRLMGFPACRYYLLN